MNLSNRSVIHKRLKCFVEFIAPEKEKREDIKRQSDDIRDCITNGAKKDGLTILSKPYSGSFAKKSGLRRQMQGNDEVEGQDIDLGFILRDEDRWGNPLTCQIETFEKYLRDNYPNSIVGHTKSSATIAFKRTKLQFDIIPLIETSRKNIQKLIRTNGEIRQSSVQQQAEFIKKRNRSSNELDGLVKFNECLRLVKWWRYQRQANSGIFGNGDNDSKVPSFLLDLLCAKAYDETLVKATYPETLASWFGFLAHTVRNRKTVRFTDFIKAPKNENRVNWKVLDPMDDTNNVVENWPDYKINELAKWFEESRGAICRAIRYDEDGEDQKSMEELIQLLGNSIRNQCKE